MNSARNSMIGLVALGAAFAMPLAFAQSASTGAQQDSTQAAPTPSAPAAQPAAPGAQAKQVTWADLDTDKDGNLSKTEVTTVPALTQVFDQADSDKNGKLTADEYKAFAAANAGASAAPGQGG